MASKIVVHFKDGKTLKGSIEDFYSNKDSFHANEHKTGKGCLIEMNRVKAVFFVKTFDGDKARRRKKGFHSVSEYGQRTVVKFHDGEIMYGYSEDYYPTSKGFFLYIADPGSNNTKVFIPNHSIYDIRLGPDIDNSPYADLNPKFIQKIVPKFIDVSIEVTVGRFNLSGASVLVCETGKTYSTTGSAQPLILKLNPGKYNLHITYDNYTVKKEIDVTRDNKSFKIDMQLESHT